MLALICTVGAKVKKKNRIAASGHPGSWGIKVAASLHIEPRVKFSGSDFLLWTCH